MPVFSQMRWLATSRLTRIVGQLAAELEISRELVHLNRLPLVNAFDDELFGRFIGRLLAAEIIADDQKAVVHEALEIKIHSHVLPNVKIGEHLPQKLLNRIKQLENSALSPAGENALRDWEQQLAERLVRQVQNRLNHMAAGMFLDDFSYDRFGIKLANATWGMPANLKVTASPSWATHATATPLNDIWGVNQVARFEYGVEFDTITMSTAAFRDMTQTVEFSNKAGVVLGTAFLTPPGALPTKNDPEMLRVGMQILGMDIVLDDAVMRVKNADGTETTSRYLPVNKVILTRKADHGSGMAYDMGNAVVTESIVADLIGGAPQGLGGETFGPTSYYTGDPELNPPTVTAWGVQKAFPRKFLFESSAVLQIG